MIQDGQNGGEGAPLRDGLPVQAPSPSGLGHSAGIPSAINLDGPFEPWRGKDANGSNPLDRVYWPMGKDYTRAYNLARWSGGFGNLANTVEKEGWIRAVLAVPNCGRKSAPIALAMLNHLGLFDFARLDHHPDYAKAARIAAKAIEARSDKTGTGLAEGESAAPQGFAQTQSGAD